MRDRRRRPRRSSGGTGLRIELAKQTQRAVDQPVIEPSRCYQRRNGHRASKPPARPHRRADRKRQVGVGARARRADWRRDRQRRQRADLSRPADFERGAEQPTSCNVPNIGCTACRMAPIPAPRPTGRRWRGTRSAKCRRPARCRSWSAGPAFICARCSTGSRRSPRSMPESPRGSRGDGRGQSRPAGTGSIPKRRRGSIPRTRRGSRARWRSSCRPEGPSREWQKQREGGIARRGRSQAVHPAAAARVALCALRRALRGRWSSGRGGGGEALLERKLTPTCR